VLKRPQGLTQFMVLLLVMLSLVASCDASGQSKTSQEVRVGANANGHMVELEKGQTLLVLLEANPTTGYRWEAVGLDTQILRSMGDPEFEPYSAQVGGPGMEIMRFEAVARGQVTLNIVYHRPWERDVQPLQTYILLVKVR
jgi:inhibitor of cysteine peptidase